MAGLFRFGRFYAAFGWHEKSDGEPIHPPIIAPLNVAQSGPDSRPVIKL
jgi:hypothetical protein